jgi:hypothetical protein
MTTLAVNKLETSLIDDTRVVIYYRHTFIEWATAWKNACSLHGASTFSITILSLMTLSIMDLIVTITLGITILGISIECHNAECCGIFLLLCCVVAPLTVELILLHQ